MIAKHFGFGLVMAVTAGFVIALEARQVTYACYTEIPCDVQENCAELFGNWMKSVPETEAVELGMEGWTDAEGHCGYWQVFEEYNCTGSGGSENPAGKKRYAGWLVCGL